nr:hypothetical protein GCM10010200_083160 [Actinomadura rugatobispora]
MLTASSRPRTRSGEQRRDKDRHRERQPLEAVCRVADVDAQTRDPRLGTRASQNGGEHTGPSPVDRGKPGSKLHIPSDRNGLPLLVAVSAGNGHDSHASSRGSEPK